MSWTLGSIPLDGSTGFALASVQLGTGMVETAEITSVHDWDDEGPAFGDALALMQGGDTVLYGTITKVEPYAQGGGAQGRKYTLSNAWWQLERTAYMQPWSYMTVGGLVTKYRSKVWLGTADDGTRESTAAAIDRILDYAESVAGISMAHAISGFGVIAPVTEATDTTCAALILQLLRWHPNVVPYWRYTASSGTLHLKPLSLLSGVTLKVSGATLSDPAPVQASVTAREDLIPPCVVVKYERLNEFDDGEGGTVQQIEYHEDKAGAGSETSPGALVFTIELQGIKASSIVQPIRTRTVPDEFADDEVPSTPDAPTQEAAAKWYQSHIAALKALPKENIRVDEHLKVFDTSETTEDADPDDAADPPPEGDPEDYPRELVEGTIQEWMTGIKATPMVAKGTFALRGDVSGFTTAQQKIAKLLFGEDLQGVRAYHVRYMATDATTRRYRTIGSFSAPEAWPTGLAAAIYAEISGVRHQGSVTVRKSPTHLAVLPGHLLTLVGQTGSGPVQRVSIDPASGRTSISFGWPDHRSPQDLYELLRASRSNEMTATYDARRKSAASPVQGGSNAIAGALRGPRADTQPVNSASAVEDNFHVTIAGTNGDASLIANGQLGGITPAIGGVTLDTVPPPTLDLSAAASGTLYVYAVISATHTSTLGYVRATVINSISIQAFAPLKTDVLTGTYYKLIATVTNGVVVGPQPLRESKSIKFEDAGTKDGKANIYYL